MSIVGTQGDFNWVAGGTISRMHVLIENSSDRGNSVIVSAADTDEPVGIAANDANTTNPNALEIIEIVPGHKYTVLNSGGVTAGDLIACTSGGSVITGAHGDFVWARACETVTTGLPTTVRAIPGYFYAVDN